MAIFKKPVTVTPHPTQKGVQVVRDAATKKGLGIVVDGKYWNVTEYKSRKK